MQPYTFVFFGMFGSGKGTQIKLLMEYLKSKHNKEVVYAGTGEGLRSLLSLENDTSKVVKDYMMRGELIPDFLVTSLVTSNFISNLTPDKTIFMDGYPRTVAQSEVFESMMKFFNRENIKLIYIELSKDEAVKRNSLRGREDDTEDSFNKRYEEHLNNELPAMQYFENKSGYEVFKINGEKSIEEVHQDIINLLKL